MNKSKSEPFDVDNTGREAEVRHIFPKISADVFWFHLESLTINKFVEQMAMKSILVGKFYLVKRLTTR